MIRHLCTVGTVVSIVCSSPYARAAEVPTKFTPFSATYGIYWLGLPVYSGSIRVKSVAGSYDIAVNNSSRGLMNLIRRSKHDIVASGRINGALRSNQHYRLLSRLSGKRIQVEIERDNAGKVQVRRQVRPAKKIKKKRPPVSQARMKEAFDPASGFLLGVMRPLDGRPCARSIPFFDGIRRFNIAFSGTSEIPKTIRQPGLQGTRAVRCRIHVRRIAGFTQTEARDTDRAVKRKATVLFVWAPQYGLWVPLRIKYDSKWGPVSIEILRIRLDNKLK